MSEDLVGILVCGAILVIAMLGVAKCNADQALECERRGGHIKSIYKGRLCLTADGRVIEWD